MSWAAELCRAFRELHAGGRPRVGFAGRDDTVGDVGRAFNALAAELEQVGANGLTRAHAHRLRNRLAGILAALHLLAESGALTADQQAGLQEIIQEARTLETAALRPRGR